MIKSRLGFSGTFNYIMNFTMLQALLMVYVYFKSAKTALVPSNLDCQWECLDDGPSSCLCVVRDSTSRLTWFDSKRICENGGAQFARIDSPELLRLLEKLVKMYIPNYGYSGSGPFDTSKPQVAAISLQRDQCNVNGTRRYIWKDNCVEKKFLETELSQLFPNYSNPNYNWSPQLPLSNAMSSIICDTSITYFITSPGLGPWDDYDCCNQPYPYQPSGTACRYDLNPCWSSPCGTNMTCQPDKSCFKCIPNCPYPLSINNGTMTGVGFSLLSQDSVNVDRSVAYSCQNGFYLEGSSTITCTNKTTWNYAPPVCKPVCQTPVIANGIAQLSSAVPKENTTVQFSCDTNFNLTGSKLLICLSTGLWSDTTPICKGQSVESINGIVHGTINKMTWWWLFFAGFVGIALMIGFFSYRQWARKKKASPEKH